MDRRKTYLIGLDTETANGIMAEDGKLDLSQSLVYDIGWQVTDKKGNIFVKRSYCVAEIFLDKSLMSSAYYAEKVPRYWKDIKAGKRELKRFLNIQHQFFEDCKEYNVKAVFAHNAAFDLKALNNTIRLLTGSNRRYFFPKKIEIWDTLKMSRDIFGKKKGYSKFCFENGFMTKHRPPQNRYTAEVLYRFITNNPDFEESHTGLEDVEIETIILVECFRAHKKMRKLLFE